MFALKILSWLEDLNLKKIIAFIIIIIEMTVVTGIGKKKLIDQPLTRGTKDMVENLADDRHCFASGFQIHRNNDGSILIISNEVKIFFLTN